MEIESDSMFILQGLNNKAFQKQILPMLEPPLLPPPLLHLHSSPLYLPQVFVPSGMCSAPSGFHDLAHAILSA